MEKKIYLTGRQFVAGCEGYFTDKNDALQVAIEEGSSFIIEATQKKATIKEKKEGMSIGYDLTLLAWKTSVASREELAEKAKEDFPDNNGVAFFPHDKDKKFGTQAFFLLTVANEPIIVSIAHFHSYTFIKKP